MITLEKLLAGAKPNGACLECWIAPSQVYANIYGIGKAHRFVWEQIKGPIPKGRQGQCGATKRLKITDWGFVVTQRYAVSRRTVSRFLESCPHD